MYHLNIGQPDLPSPASALEAIRSINRTTLEYSPSDGYRFYRENLVGYYEKFGIHLSPEDIIVTTGGSEAVLYAFLACLNPGDEIIVPEPAYANYMAFAISAATIRTIPSTMETDLRCRPWRRSSNSSTSIPREYLSAIPTIRPATSTAQGDGAVRDLVKRYNLYLFSDEVYREFIYNDTPYVSACHLEGIEENVVLIDSVSKRYSECGIRIGALITRNRRLHETVMKFCQARLSPLDRSDSCQRIAQGERGVHATQLRRIQEPTRFPD